MQSNKIHNVVLMSKFYSALLLARHVSDLIGPSSGVFCISCICRLWYVVICVLLDTSSRYKVVELTKMVNKTYTLRPHCVSFWTKYIYYKMIHGPYNVVISLLMLKYLIVESNYVEGHASLTRGFAVLIFYV